MKMDDDLAYNPKAFWFHRFVFLGGGGQFFFRVKDLQASKYLPHVTLASLKASAHGICRF